MTKKDEMAVPPTFPQKLKDPGKFTITCTVGGVNIPHDLCDLGSSINVMPLNQVKELNLGEIIPSNRLSLWVIYLLLVRLVSYKTC